jgi:hypothetical protein
MVSNRFSPHSPHNLVEHFHHLKQTTSASEYIQKFEDLMSLIQMYYPGLTESYFVSSFITVLKDGIKHYLIPHSPQSLCDAYWKAKVLEKGILHKKISSNLIPPILQIDPNLHTYKSFQAISPTLTNHSSQAKPYCPIKPTTKPKTDTNQIKIA